jgi:steroid delta-isomerase-like uncharacterized protein
MDLHMLVIHGGAERSWDDFSHLREAAGFTLLRCIPLDVGVAIFEARAWVNPSVLIAWGGKGDSMSTEGNKELVRRFIDEVWNAGNLDLTYDLIHPEYRIGDDGLRGPEAVIHNVRTYHAAFPDLHWQIEQMVAEDDCVAVRLVLTGTHRGEFRGIPATGRRIAMHEMAFWRIVESRLHTLWAQADALGMRIHLGAIPATAWHQPVIGPGSEGA